MAMLFFTVVNALVFVATILFIPSMPVKEKVSYGAQLSVLKKTEMWHSIIAVTLINGAMFGFFSYMSDYLKTVTEVSYNVISADKCQTLNNHHAFCTVSFLYLPVLRRRMDNGYGNNHPYFRCIGRYRK